MRFYLAQLKPKIGDIQYNCNLIEQHYSDSLKQECQFCVFPELILCGYNPSDLLSKSNFIQEIEECIHKLKSASKQTVLLLPTPWMENGKLYNAVLALQHGEIIGKTYKYELPNYGVFDESRYFSSGSPTVIEAHGIKIGIPICEDIWHPYVPKKLKQDGAEILIVPNASPFENGKFNQRLATVQRCWQETQVPVIYCNQVLGLDGIVYDGRSFGYDGEIKFSMPSFTEHVQVIEVHNDAISHHTIHHYDDKDLLYGAMVLGLRDYIEHNGFESVVVGLSGGVDSALVTTIAADAIGPNKVLAVMMPSQFTSKTSITDAEQLLLNLSPIQSRIVDITGILTAASTSIPDMSSLAYENMQARIRGMLLMSISNTENRLLLSTGNKSEIATGYCTIYGDMCGGFNPIKDLYKTQVWDLCRWRNNYTPSSISVHHGITAVIPDSIINKEPTAELRPNQKDKDNLPDYHLLDQVLQLYLEKNLGVKQIIELGFDNDVVMAVDKLINSSEHKRQQAAPGVKLSNRSFTRDRRMPISHHYIEKKVSSS